MMEMVIFYWGIIYALVLAGIYVVKRFDTEVWKWTKEEGLSLLFGSAVNSVVIFVVSKACCMNQMTTLLLAILAGCLFFACMTDYKSCEVFQFTWWIGGLVSSLLLYQWLIVDAKVCGSIDLQKVQQIVTLLFYAMLQELFFSRFYGRADCHAFVICAVAECVLGIGLLGYLLQMILAFGGLAVVQAFRGNINRKGNLKKPVAFVPYITFSFWILLYYCFSL